MGSASGVSRSCNILLKYYRNMAGLGEKLYRKRVSVHIDEATLNGANVTGSIWSSYEL